MSISLHNPFSTRFTRPGQLSWRSRDQSPAVLLDRLEQIGGRGIIFGPHGSGKTTLLYHLMVEASARGWPIRHLRLRSWSQWPLAVSMVLSPGTSDHFHFIDSWEALAWPRDLLARIFAQQSRRIVVTTHQPRHCGNWPVLWKACLEKHEFHGLVADLLRQSDGAPIKFESSLLDEIFIRHGGNIREAFFELYDLYEQQIRCKVSA